ncbi:MAG: ABC transporter transmembrane domain-containing protein, partial [Candidatus Cloacimonadaceae bacterium]|nr:ABC transporter transmembrane domain-containing protein [Candidatus Cloacimonadaceae bacterium]
MTKNVKWVINQWMKQKGFVLLMLVFTLGSSAVSIAYPMVFRRLIDILQRTITLAPELRGDQMASVNRVIMLFLAIGVAQLVTGFYPALRGWMNVRFEHSLRMFYFRFITHKDFTFFQKYRTGDVVTRLTDDLSDFPKISWFLCSGIFRAVNSFSLILFSLVVMFSINPRLTLLSIAPL